MSWLFATLIHEYNNDLSGKYHIADLGVGLEIQGLASQSCSVSSIQSGEKIGD